MNEVFEIPSNFYYLNMYQYFVVGNINCRPDDTDLNSRFYEIRKYFHTEVKAL